MGPHKGQRSVRLNKGWRAFCRVTVDGEVELVTVVEVNKHVYNR